MAWTILKPSAFMRYVLWFKKPVSNGILLQVAGKGSVSWVDTRDVARVAATVLTEDGHHDIDPTCEIDRLTGIPPCDFATFLRDHRAQFVGAE